MNFLCACTMFAISTSSLLAAGAANASDEASLRAAAAAQLQAGSTGDVEAMAAIQHPDYLGNAPNNRVVDGATVRSMMASGAIASERFERVIERAAITGNIGVVMGRESVLPTTRSVSGQMFEANELQRRFTNIFVWQGGQWRLLARHANVVP